MLNPWTATIGKGQLFRWREEAGAAGAPAQVVDQIADRHRGGRVEIGEQLGRRAAQQIDQQIDSALIQAGIAKAGVKRAAETAGNELQRMIDARLDAALERLGVARSREVQELTARVEFLEKKLAGG